MQRTDFVCGLPWLNSKPERAIFDEQQFACVYAVGPVGGRPLRIGWARQIKDRMQALQLGCWKELTIHHIVWTAGDMLAIRVMQDAIGYLDKRRLYGDWFDVPVELGVNAVRIAADKQQFQTFSHSQMLERIRNIRKDRIEATIRGV